MEIGRHHDAVMLREANDLDVLDVPDVVPYAVMDSVVDAEELSAFAASPDLVQAVLAYFLNLVATDAAPFPEAGFHQELGLGPLLPVDIGEVACHAAFVGGTALEVDLAVASLS